MTINTGNYEAFLLDAIEGRLSPEDQAALLVFLSEHPELEADFDLADFELPTVAATEKSGFDALRMPAPFTSKDLWMAAVAEGDLDDAFARAALADADHAAAIAGLKRMKLAPDTAVVYPNKAALRRGAPVIQLQWVYRAAAVAAVLFGLFLGGWWMLNQDAPARLARFTPRELEVTKNPVQTDADSGMNTVGTINNTTPQVDRDGASIQKNNDPDAPLATNTEDARGSAPRKLAPRPAINVAAALPERNAAGAVRPLDASVFLTDEDVAELTDDPLSPPAKKAEQRSLTVTEYLAREAQTRIKGEAPAANEALGTTLATAAESKVENISNGQVAFRRKGNRSFFLKVGQLSIER
ncbi:MAG: hypothetical protein ACFCUH_04920 [Flavobacteriales bacterium]